jgi:hypothetical protein
MDYDRLKAEIKAISELAQSVPEQFRDKCFDLLLSNLLSGEKKSSDSDRDRENDQDKDGDEKIVKSGPIPVTTQVRVLMKKTGVTEEQLGKILLYEGGEVHFIVEPRPKGITTGQMEWSLLLALKNAILKNDLSVDPEDVRSVCQDKGYYDKANFAKTFKAGKNAAFFKKPLIPQGEAQQLSPAGQDALGALITRLASEAK